MAKTTGLGANFYVQGIDISGDVGAMNSIMVSAGEDNVTGISKSAVERLALIEQGEISFMSFFSDAVTAENAHDLLKSFTGEKQGQYWDRPTLGADVASIVGRQFVYNLARNADGSLRGSAALKSSGGVSALDWGVGLTAGKEVETAPLNMPSVDGAAASTGGARVYLQVFALTGTNVIATVQDSADNSVFANLTGGAFTSVTAPPKAQMLSISGTIRRYVRVVLSGTFTSATLAVALTRL